MTPDCRIGMYFTPGGVQMAGWIDRRWQFRAVTHGVAPFDAVRDWLHLSDAGRPIGRCEINLGFRDVQPDLSCWPPLLARWMRIAHEDFRGVVGVRVLERLARPLPQIQHDPIGVLLTAAGLTATPYDPAPQPEPDDSNAEPPPFAVCPGQLPAHALPGQCVLIPACGSFAEAVALVLAPWAILLDADLPEPLTITPADATAGRETLSFAAIDRPGSTSATVKDHRLSTLHAAWAGLFDLATELLYMDGYDTDDSVATRLLIDSTAEPVFGIDLERVGTLADIARACSDVWDDCDAFTPDVAALRVTTVELDKPVLPTVGDGFDRPGEVPGWTISDGPRGQFMARRT